MHRLKSLDLCQPRSALLAVLLLRVVWGAWAALISSLFPETGLERAVPVLPAQILSGDWWQRVAVMPWMRQDWEYYERIITPGYSTTDGSASFHPLYPMLAKPLFWAGLNANASLLVVGTVAAWTSTLILARYTRRFHAREGDGRFPSVAAWFFLLNPLGWIVLAPYTEGTFLSFAIASVWAMRVRRFWLAALLAALATLTRQQGLMLLAPLLWYLWRPEAGGDRAQVLAAPAPIRDWLGVMLIPLAYAGFSLYRVRVLGEAPDMARGPVGYVASWLVSPSARLVIPESGLAAPWKPIAETLRLLPITPYPYHLLFDIIGGWAMVWILMRGWKRLSAGEAAWCAGVIFSATCFYSAPYMGFPRHMMLAFPLSILVAAWARERGKTRFLLEAMVLGNLLLCAGFVRHSWVP